jgi:K+-transporting ATPase A subunit
MRINHKGALFISVLIVAVVILGMMVYVPGAFR